MLKHERRAKPAAFQTMKDHQNQPDDVRLSALLNEARVAPGLPPRFQQNVWRRIEDAEAPVKPATWLDTFATLILRPRFAMATAAALVLAGVFMGSLEGRQEARHDARMNYLSAVAPHTLR